MRTLLMKKAAGYIATASLVASPFLSSAATTAPAQTVFTTIHTTSTRPVRQNEDPALARNTSVKTDISAVKSTTKEQKVEDKKAIGRCWKRLMNMAREIRQAHRNKN